MNRLFQFRTLCNVPHIKRYVPPHSLPSSTLFIKQEKTGQDSFSNNQTSELFMKWLKRGLITASFGYLFYHLLLMSGETLRLENKVSYLEGELKASNRYIFGTMDWPQEHVLESTKSSLQTYDQRMSEEDARRVLEMNKLINDKIIESIRSK